MKCYSEKGENFNFVSIEDLARQLIDDETVRIGDVVTIHRGEAIKRKAGEYMQGCGYDIDEMICNAYDDCGEYAEGWLSGLKKDVISELEDSIKTAVNLWADKHDLHPTFYTVVNTDEVKIKIVDDNGGYEMMQLSNLYANGIGKARGEA